MPLAALDGGRRDPAAEGRLDHVVDRRRRSRRAGPPCRGRGGLPGTPCRGPGRRPRRPPRGPPSGRPRSSSDARTTSSRSAAQHAHADGRVHARRQHVHAVLDRHGPDVGPAGHLHGPVQLAAEPDQVGPVLRPEEQPAGERPRRVAVDGPRPARAAGRGPGSRRDRPVVVVGRSGRGRRVGAVLLDRVPAGRAGSGRSAGSGSITSSTASRVNTGAAAVDAARR